MKFVNTFFGASVFLLLTCCTNETQSSVEVVPAHPDMARTVQLSEIFESIRYIPLETIGEENLIYEEIGGLYVDDERIIVFQDLSTREAIFVYDGTGKLQYKIENPGEGPGRIYTASDFLVDTVQGYIEVLDRIQKKILRYRLEDGEIAGELRIPQGFRKFVKMDKDKYVFFAGNETFGDHHPFNIISVNLKNDYQRYSLPIPSYLHRYFIKEQNFARGVDGTSLLKYILSDTIYRIQSNAVKAAYVVDYGNHWVEKSVLDRLAVNNRSANRRSLLYNRQDHVFHIVTFFETKEYLFFTNFFQGKLFWNIYDKRTQKSFITHARKNDIDFGLVGDLLYWPLTNCGNDYVVFLLLVEDVVDKINELQKGKMKEPDRSKFEQFAALKKKIAQNGNPVIALAKIRRDGFGK